MLIPLSRFLPKIINMQKLGSEKNRSRFKKELFGSQRVHTQNKRSKSRLIHKKNWLFYCITMCVFPWCENIHSLYLCKFADLIMATLGLEPLTSWVPVMHLSHQATGCPANQAGLLSLLDDCTCKTQKTYFYSVQLPCNFVILLCGTAPDLRSIKG